MVRIKQIAKKNFHKKNKLYQFKEDIINTKKIKIFINNLSLNKIFRKIKSSYKKKFEYEINNILLQATENLLIELFINSQIHNSKNQISNSQKLISKREIIKTIETGNFIEYICKIKINQKEILLIFDGYGKIILYDLKTYEKLLKLNYFFGYLRIFDISELENEMIMISSNYSINIIIIEKDIFNNYCLYEVNHDDIFKIKKKIIKIKKLQSNNILLLSMKSFSIYSPQKNNTERICRKIENITFNNEIVIKKMLPDYKEILIHFTSKKYENLDIIELNKDIIIYYDTNFCNIYSINNKQIIFSIKINVSPYIDDVLKKISDDIFCIGEKNIIEFFSMKLGKVIEKIIFPNSVVICSIGCLSNNNILIGSYLEDTFFNRKLFFSQFKYSTGKNINDIIQININFSMIPGNGNGNIFIFELDDERIILTFNDSILFLNK